MLSDPQWYPLLDTVMAIVGENGGRHNVEPDQIEEIAQSAWLTNPTGLRASTLEFLRGAARVFSRTQLSGAVTIKLDAMAPRWGVIETGRMIKIHPFGGLVLLVQPLHVIVEDETSDGAFLLWMARLLGMDSVRKAYRQGHFVFRHAGGKMQLVKSARALTYGVWDRGTPILSQRLRAIVVLDSDSAFPGARPNAEIVSKVGEEVALVHELKRRAIENYVPEKYFRSRLCKAEHKPRADAYFRMTEVQRSHFPLKRGFVRTGDAQTHSEFLADDGRDERERDLYRPLPPDDWLLLRSGVGDVLADVYRLERYRCDQGGEPMLLTADARTELAGLLTDLVRYL